MSSPRPSSSLQTSASQHRNYSAVAQAAPPPAAAAAAASAFCPATEEDREGTTSNFDSNDTARLLSYQSTSSYEILSEEQGNKCQARLSPLRPDNIDTTHRVPLKMMTLRASRHRKVGPKKRYELWQGKHTFLCDGRIMIGSHPLHLALSYLMIITTWGLFTLYICPAMPKAGAFIATSTIAATTMLALLTLGATVEPGLIPNRSHHRPMEELIFDAFEKAHLCRRCNAIQRPRTRHCRYCDACCDEFDHHCPWMGTCVGKRNYRFFFTFILVTFLSACFAAITCLSALLRHSTPPVVRVIIAPVLAVWLVTIALLVGGLLAFHCMLLSNGQTTHEYMKEEEIDPLLQRTPLDTIRERFFVPILESRLLPMHEYVSLEDRDDALYAVLQGIQEYTASQASV